MVIEAIETLERVPGTYLRPIKTKKGLYEARVQLENMTRTVLEQAFRLHLNPSEVMPVAKQIHEVLKRI